MRCESDGTQPSTINPTANSAALVRIARPPGRKHKRQNSQGTLLQSLYKTQHAVAREQYCSSSVGSEARGGGRVLNVCQTVHITGASRVTCRAITILAGNSSDGESPHFLDVHLLSARLNGCTIEVR